MSIKTQKIVITCWLLLVTIAIVMDVSLILYLGMSEDDRTTCKEMKTLVMDCNKTFKRECELSYMVSPIKIGI